MSFKNKLKPTPTGNIRKIAEEDEQHFKGSTGDGHKLETGLNKFRFYPAHPGEPSFFRKKVSHWGKIENDKNEAVSRKVPDGKHHGGLSADPIDAYIALCQDKLDGANEKEAEKLAALTNNKTGLQGKFKWIAYADKIVAGAEPVFDFFEFSKTIRDFIKKETVIDDAEEAIDNDPFTDPTEGRCMIVDYNGAAKSAKDYYKSVRLAKGALELTEEQCENFVTNVTPLSKLPEMQYTLKNFETALEIVKFFDEDNEINLFDSDEYQETIATLKKEMKGGAGKKAATAEDDEDAPAPKKAAKPVAAKKPAKVEEEDEEEEDLPVVKAKAKKGDEFDAMDREELKAYKAEAEMEFKVYKTTTDDEIRVAIRAELAVRAAADEEEEEVDTKKAAKIDDEEEDDVPVKAKGTKPDLASIKSKLRG